MSETQAWKIGDRVNWKRAAEDNAEAGVIKKIGEKRITIEVARQDGDEWVRETKSVSSDKLTKRQNYVDEIDGELKKQQDIKQDTRDKKNALKEEADNLKVLLEKQYSKDIKIYAANLEKGNYRGEIVLITDSYVAQKVSDKSIVVHRRENLIGQDIVKGDAQIQYVNSRGQVGPMQQREKKEAKNVEAGDELTRLKNEHVGKDAKLYVAHENNGRSSYTGTVIAETGTHVLQRLSDKTVIVHEKINLNKDVEVGQNVNITYTKGRVFVNDPSEKREQAQTVEDKNKSIEQKTTVPGDERQSFFQARGIIKKEFGDTSKIYDANLDKGDYKGQIVALTDQHVAQRLGANTFVVHERARVAGDYRKGQNVQIKYDGQVAQALTREPPKQGQHLSKGLAR